LRILQVHNRYRPGWGGEDTVADQEAELLRREGNEVGRLLVSTAELDGATPARLITAALGTVWSMRGYFAMQRAIKSFSPDIIHVHNTFPLLSPSIFWAASRSRVPIIHTLHNFRLTCANALLLRDGNPCQLCVGQFPWAGLRYRCYAGSLWRTLVVTASNLLHRRLGTFAHKVQAYIALTDFSKDILVRSGLPADKIHVKANFSPAQTTPRSQERARQIIFVGDISRHKGIHVLLDAWASIPKNGNRLLIVGDGVDRPDLQKQYANDATVVWCGSVPRHQVLENIAVSRLLILPSLCYENVPMVVVEAFSVGTPVIVPNHGAFPSLVSDRKQGLLFTTGSASSLASAILEGLHASQEDWTAWSKNTRDRFVDQFTGASNYQRLISIYHKTIEDFRSEYDVQSRLPGAEQLSQNGIPVSVMADKTVKES
jgi:glycosyltransferase involved in cell wall biosynthesis